MEYPTDLLEYLQHADERLKECIAYFQAQRDLADSDSAEWTATDLLQRKYAELLLTSKRPASCLKVPRR